MRNLFDSLVAVVFMGGLLLSAACSTPETVHHKQDELDPRPAGVYLRMGTAKFTDDHFDVQMYFEENTAYFDGVLQEIEFDPDGDGDTDYTLVEYFKLPYGKMRTYTYDRHAGSDWHRRMVVYPANVEDVDWMYESFAQLPQNRDGSKVTFIPDGWNKAYRDSHETNGRVVADAKELAVVWEIHYDAKKRSLTVTLPDEE